MQPLQASTEAAGLDGNAITYCNALFLYITARFCPETDCAPHAAVGARTLLSTLLPTTEDMLKQPPNKNQVDQAALEANCSSGFNSLTTLYCAYGGLHSRDQ